MFCWMKIESRLACLWTYRDINYKVVQIEMLTGYFNSSSYSSVEKALG